MLVYSLMEVVMAEAILQEVEAYVSCRHNTVTQSITARTIMEVCLVAERIPGPRVSKRWWEQERVDVEGIWTADREAERTEGEEDMDRTEMETD